MCNTFLERGYRNQIQDFRLMKSSTVHVTSRGKQMFCGVSFQQKLNIKLKRHTYALEIIPISYNIYMHIYTYSISPQCVMQQWADHIVVPLNIITLYKTLHPVLCLRCVILDHTHISHPNTLTCSFTCILWWFRSCMNNVIRPGDQ